MHQLFLNVWKVLIPAHLTKASLDGHVRAICKLLSLCPIESNLREGTGLSIGFTSSKISPQSLPHVCFIDSPSLLNFYQLPGLDACIDWNAMSSSGLTLIRLIELSRGRGRGVSRGALHSWHVPLSDTCAPSTPSLVSKQQHLWAHHCFRHTK